MKNTPLPKFLAPPKSPETPSVSRYQIYRQTHAGIYAVELRTDSAVEAVEAFLNQSPAFEGGQLGLWNQWEQRVGAAVECRVEETAFGFPLFSRTNIFHDRLLELVARERQVREALREEIQHSIRMSA